jgi:tetratricopeptide (TPR) repeat protein
MDPLRSDNPEQLTGADRDARIEQLLLSGLDQYFAGAYDQAINLWTRVLFLDRQHDRARAYIDRARSAQAEKQRESEALLHQGIEAFKAGEVERSRELLDHALEQGAPRDLVLGMLDRIARLGGARQAELPAAPRPVTSRTPSPPTVRPAALRRKRLASASLLLILAALGAAAVAVWGLTLPDLSALRVFAVDNQIATPLPATVDEPLPVPAATEVFITRARALFATGRLRDALTELDLVPLGDPLRADADRLRGDIQRELLTVAAAENAPAK